MPALANKFRRRSSSWGLGSIDQIGTWRLAQASKKVLPPWKRPISTMPTFAVWASMNMYSASQGSSLVETRTSSGGR
jgi:hypothetical protein